MVTNPELECPSYGLFRFRRDEVRCHRVDVRADKEIHHNCRDWDEAQSVRAAEAGLPLHGGLAFVEPVFLPHDVDFGDNSSGNELVKQDEDERQHREQSRGCDVAARQVVIGGCFFCRGGFKFLSRGGFSVKQPDPEKHSALKASQLAAQLAVFG